MTDPTSASRPPRLTLRLPAWAAIGGFITGLLGVWYALPETPVQAVVCRHVPDRLELPSSVCNARYRRVSVDEAALAVDSFLGKASGSTPKNALTLWESTEGLDRDEFVSGWTEILYADRVGDVASSSRGRNWFTFSYTTYDGDGNDIDPRSGDVNIYETQIELMRSEDGVKIVEIAPVDRTAGSHQRYVQRKPRQELATYDAPGRPGVAAPRVPHDQHLSLLCQIELSDGSWWSRTGWGWVKHVELRGALGRVEGEPMCDSHHVERAVG